MTPRQPERSKTSNDEYFRDEIPLQKSKSTGNKIIGADHFQSPPNAVREQFD